MRRSLVLTNEAARHPFRASLPVRAVTIPGRRQPPRILSNLRDFVLSFCAFFLAALVFIA